MVHDKSLSSKMIDIVVHIFMILVLFATIYPVLL